MSLFALGLLVVALTLAGGRWRGLVAWPGQEAPYRLALHFVAGVVGLFAALLLWDAVGLSWRPLTVAAALALAALVAHLASRGRGEPAAALPWRPGWGDGAALAALAALALATGMLWSVNPDYVYHWGLKGARFYLARGIDSTFLAQPWNWYTHPDYPNLLPTLFAATATVAGRFAPRAALLWTPLFLAALLAAGRQVLRQAGVSRFAGQATLAAVGLSVAGFGIGFLTGGGPDWLMALAPVAAWPAMLGRPHRAKDLAVGMAAALAAASKLEGLPMAAFLVAVHLAGRGGGRLRALPRLLAPPLVVVLPWLAEGLTHDLFRQSHLAAPTWSRLGPLLGAVGEGLLTPEWHGAALALALLPLLCVPRATRPVAAVCSLQLGFYLFVYLATPLASEDRLGFFVSSNFARLTLHLVPATLLATAVAAEGWVRGASRRGAPER